MVLVFSSLGSFKPNLSAICNSLCDLNVTSASMRRLMTVNCRAWFDLNGLDVQSPDEHQDCTNQTSSQFAACPLIIMDFFLATTLVENKC